VRWDPGYIYVDCGEEFRRSHAVAYPDGDTPTTTFGSAVWAREYALSWGGSAYLPERLITPLLDSAMLHRLPNAPEFARAAYVVVNNHAAAQWPWLSDMTERAGATQL